MNKLLICGKGGCGKSTVAALLATAMQKRDKKVFLVDADESNIGLYRMLALVQPEPLMDSLGGKKGFREKTSAAGATLGGPPSVFANKMPINDLPKNCISQKNGLKVMSVGKIHHFGEGCACPMGNLFRMLFSSLDLTGQDLVIVDTAAGVEHFGRRLDAQCDQILCVVEPSYESIAMAHRVKGLAREINLPVRAILNKTTPDIEADLANALDGIPVLGSLPNHETIFKSNLEGKSLDMDLPQMEAICDAVEEIPNAG